MKQLFWGRTICHYLVTFGFCINQYTLQALGSPAIAGPSAALPAAAVDVSRKRSADLPRFKAFMRILHQDRDITDVDDLVKDYFKTFKGKAFLATKIVHPGGDTVSVERPPHWNHSWGRAKAFVYFSSMVKMEAAVEVHTHRLGDGLVVKIEHPH